MSEFTKSLVVSPLADGRTWVLLESFAYDVGEEGSGDTIHVPALFMTDFASVPRPFWAIFPPWGKYGNAAVIHDWGYRTQTRPRAAVDAIFLEGMQVLGVSWLARHLIYWSVRTWGWAAWWADARRSRRGEAYIAARTPEKSVERKEQLQDSWAPATLARP